MRRLSFLLLALAASGAASAQGTPPDLDGVFLGASGDASFGATALTMFNPEPGATPVALTPFLYVSAAGRDTLDGRPQARQGNGGGVNSFSPAMSASGRMVYVVDWFEDTQGRTVRNVVAQDRDGSNRAILTPPDGLTFAANDRSVYPDISPDGRTVIYALTERAQRTSYGTLYRVPSDGSAEPEVFQLPDAVNADGSCAANPRRAEFSPDGTQIVYLGTEPQEFDYDGDVYVKCPPALRLINADGTGDRLLTRIRAAGATTEDDRSNRREDYVTGDFGLDWKAGRIAYSTPTHCAVIRVPQGESQCANTPVPPEGRVFDLAEGRDVGALADLERPEMLQLSPDGLTLGYGRPATEGGTSDYRIVVRPVAGGSEYVFEGFPAQRFGATFAWADVPAIPPIDRLVLETPGVLIWEGRGVALNPTLYGTDGSVISRTVRTYATPVSGDLPRVNHFSSVLWGTDRNFIDVPICARNAGLEACTLYRNVDEPILDVVVLDDDIAEEGRNPGRLRLFRYGRPDVESIPVFEALASGSNSARHYLDYTLSVLPERIRWRASDDLADTLQTMDVVLTPIDDGVAEAPFERGRIHLDCYTATGSLHGPDEENCTVAGFRVNGTPFRIRGAEDGLASNGIGVNWDFQIASNGAGSGLAIASSSPAVIPASGQATLTVQGQGFAPGATATLSGPGSATAVNVSPRFDGAQALARFEPDGLPPGSYDLTVTSDGQTSVLEGAVRVDAATPGGFTDVWVTLQSNSGRLLLPRDQVIHYGNDGTADAALTPLLIAIPEGYEPEFQTEIFHFPDPVEGYDPGASLWSAQTVRAGDVPGLCLRSRLSAGGSGGRVGGGLDCDVFAGGEDAQLGYQVAVVFLPTIPPGGRGTLTLSVTRQPGSESFQRWFVKVGAPLNTLTFEDGGDAGAALASSFAAAGPQRVQPVNLNGCASAVASVQASFDAAQAAACAGCISGLTNLAITLAENSPIGGCAAAAIATATSVYQVALDASVGGASNAVGSGLSTLGNLAKVAFECTRLAGAVVPGVGQAAVMYAAFSVLSAGLDAGGTVLACLNCLGIDPVWGVIGEVYSSDPNDKLGPVGVGAGGHVADFGRAGYTVRFENLETATAAAVEVTVVDTLDASVYDLSTFELAEITLRDTTLVPPPGVQTWNTTWARSAESVVRVLAALDVETGEVRWTLSDLDPTTYRLRTSAEAGFLPPNDADGSGEGQVRFLIRAKPDLPDGTVLANGATIQFDREALITTPVWANTIDRSAPISRAASAERFDADTSFVVRFAGTDTGAGVAGYDLYVAADDGPFEYHTSARADSVVFRGERGVSYRAFSLATDWVGNVEPPKTEAEVTFVVGGVASEGAASGPAELELAAPFPNPARGPVVVQVGVPAAGPVRVAVYDVRGREVAVLTDGDRAAGWHPVRWDGAAAAGLYVVRAQAGGRMVTRTVTVVR